VKIAFRADASLNIGTGHVMRCLTLADALKAIGSQCHFICREHPGNLIKEIRQRGFSVIGLPKNTDDWMTGRSLDTDRSSYDAWLGADSITDAAQTIVSIGDAEFDWLIVDHYAIDVSWEQQLRAKCRKVMVIDDLADRHHDCNLLLDQNLGRQVQDYNELVPADCSVLAGPTYALLRPEFAALRDYSLRRREIPQLKNILISMGGVDRDNTTGRILDALIECPLPDDLSITVVMGQHAPWLERVRLLAARMPRRTEVKVNVKDIARLMADSDLAIGAAGGTSWERCCLGLPTFIVVLAENQRKAAVALEHTGSAKVLDGLDAIEVKLRSMLNLQSMSSGLHQMSRVSCLITDGLGTSRVVRELL
jgi:UDP-2,4-diacetamido-2,4,6-trideoxy-beta-L-altropyranose hydrolase